MDAFGVHVFAAVAGFLITLFLRDADRRAWVYRATWLLVLVAVNVQQITPWPHAVATFLIASAAGYFFYGFYFKLPPDVVTVPQEPARPEPIPRPEPPPPVAPLPPIPQLQVMMPTERSALFLNEIPDEARFSHGWILAPQGAGKTQLIQQLVLRDLERVAEEECSVVVMDSQGDLIRNIRRLQVFMTTLRDKLIVIEPNPNHPIALNVFAIGKKRLNKHNPRDREQLNNSILSLLEYVFAALLNEARGMTPKQTLLFRNLIKLCLLVPDATLFTLHEMLDKGVAKYQPYIDQLDVTARAFFGSQYNDKSAFGDTRKEVGWRLSFMLENSTFAAMFGAKECKVDLYEELLSAKVILINTDVALLGEERCGLFGRVFIAMLLQAAQERAAVFREDRTPTFCYIDEAQTYIRDDPKITTIFDQARKMNVSMMVANQRGAQIKSPDVKDALLTTAIKFVNTDNDSDIHALARPLRVNPDDFLSLKALSFLVFVRNLTPVARTFFVTAGLMEDMPRMDKEDREHIREEMWKRYAYDPGNEPDDDPDEDPLEGEVIPPDPKPGKFKL